MLDTIPRKVLVGVTGDEDVRAALGFAATEARRRGAGVHLLHVVHPVLMAPDGIPITVEEHAVRKAGRKALAEASRSLEHELTDNQPVSTELAHGFAARVLVGTAEHASLVVLQHQRMGRRGFVPTLSTTNAVAARSPVPVVAVPAGWNETPERQGITVGVESPEGSQEIVRAALDEARLRRTRLRLVHAWYYSDGYDDLVFAGEAGRTHSAEKARELGAGLGPLLAEYPDVETELVVQHAREADTMVDESHRADLLVLGRHRHTFPLGPHLGSVARATLRHAACPVMVVDPVRAASVRPDPFASDESIPTFQES